jgi:uncharacterized protein YjbJ (UPF0337 family)
MLSKEEAMDKAKGVIKKAAGKLPGVETKETEGRSDQEKSSTEGNKEYFRKLIEESNERSRSRG